MLESLLPDERRDLILSTGTRQRNRRLTPIQVAHLLDRLHRIQGIPVKEIAQELELRSVSTLYKFLSLLSLSDEIQALVNWGTSPGYLSFSVASEILRAKDPEKINILVKDALENQRNKEEVRAIIQCNIREGGTLVQCIEKINSLRPKTIAHHVFVGQLPGSTNENQSEQESSSDLKTALSTLVGKENILSALVKNGRFSLVLTEPATKNPKISPYLTPKKIEVFIAKLLVQRSNDG